LGLLIASSAAAENNETTKPRHLERDAVGSRALEKNTFEARVAHLIKQS
jgi:hypothetical protein